MPEQSNFTNHHVVPSPTSLPCFSPVFGCLDRDFAGSVCGTLILIAENKPCTLTSHDISLSVHSCTFRLAVACNTTDYMYSQRMQNSIGCAPNSATAAWDKQNTLRKHLRDRVMAMTLITCHAVLVQMYGRKDTLIATCMIMSTLGANELTSSIAISDRK